MTLEHDANERLAGELRAAAATMDEAVEGLALGGGWCGPDAAAFRSRWAIDVTEPIRGAAASLDGRSRAELARLLTGAFGG